MEFQMKYTEEQGKFREEVRAFLEENISKELVQSPNFADFTLEQYQMIRKLGLKLGERGWLYPSWPKEYGGGGLSIDRAIVLFEEMSARELSLPPYFSLGANCGAASTLVHGTEEQKRFFVRDGITKGKWIVQQCITEPQGGTDAANVKVTAIRDGDDFVVNGQKCFIGDGGSYDHDYLWASVCTDPRRPKHENLGMMFIPSRLPGVTIRPMDLMERVGPQRSNEVFFDNVRVSAFHLIGEENNGWKVMNTTLDMEHGAMGRVGGRDSILERFFDYCKEAQVNGQPLSKDPDVRDRLVDIHIDSEVNRLLGLRNFWIYYTKRRRSYEQFQSGYVHKMSTLRMGDTMLQILGYFALTRDPSWVAKEGWIEAFVRESLIQVHPGGGPDIAKNNLGRRLGIGRAVREEAAAIA